jgi:cell division protein FtsZ
MDLLTKNEHGNYTEKERALNGRLLDMEEVTKAKGMLIHVLGGEDMTLEEVQHAGEFTKRSIPPKSKIIWEARINKGQKKTARVMGSHRSRKAFL